MPFNGLPSTFLATPENGGTQDVISSFIARKEKQEEEQKKEAQEFEALSKFLQVAHDVPKEALTPKDLPTLRGLARGLEQKRMQEEAKEKRLQDIAQFEQTKQLNAARLADYARAAQQDEALGAFAQQYARARGGSLAQFAPEAPENFTGLPAYGAQLAQFASQAGAEAPVLGALAQNPRAAAARGFENFMQSVQLGQKSPAARVAPVFTDVPDADAVLVERGPYSSVVPKAQGKRDSEQFRARMRAMNERARAISAQIAKITAQEGGLIKIPVELRMEKQALQGDLAALQRQQDALLNGDDEGSAGGPPAGGGKNLTREQAKALLDEAGGDAEQARALARKRGYTF